MPYTRLLFESKYYCGASFANCYFKTRNCAKWYCKLQNGIVTKWFCANFCPFNITVSGHELGVFIFLLSAVLLNVLLTHRRRLVSNCVFFIFCDEYL